MKKTLIVITLLLFSVPCFAQVYSGPRRYGRRVYYPPPMTMQATDWWLYEQSFGGADGYTNLPKEQQERMFEENKEGVISTFEKQPSKPQGGSASSYGYSDPGYPDPTIYQGP